MSCRCATSLDFTTVIVREWHGQNFKTMMSNLGLIHGNLHSIMNNSHAQVVVKIAIICQDIEMATSSTYMMFKAPPFMKRHGSTWKDINARCIQHPSDHTNSCKASGSICKPLCPHSNLLSQFAYSAQLFLDCQTIP